MILILRNRPEDDDRSADYGDGAGLRFRACDGCGRCGGSSSDCSNGEEVEVETAGGTGTTGESRDNLEKGVDGEACPSARDLEEGAVGAIADGGRL